LSIGDDKRRINLKREEIEKFISKKKKNRGITNEYMDIGHVIDREETGASWKC